MKEKFLKYGKILLILLMSFMVGSMIAFAFQVKELRPSALKSYNSALAAFNSAKRALCETEHVLRLSTLLDAQKGLYRANTEELQRLSGLVANNSCDF